MKHRQCTLLHSACVPARAEEHQKVLRNTPQSRSRARGSRSPTPSFRAHHIEDHHHRSRQRCSGVEFLLAVSEGALPSQCRARRGAQDTNQSVRTGRNPKAQCHPPLPPPPSPQLAASSLQHLYSGPERTKLQGACAPRLEAWDHPTCCSAMSPSLSTTCSTDLSAPRSGA